MGTNVKMTSTGSCGRQLAPGFRKWSCELFPSSVQPDDALIFDDDDDGDDDDDDVVVANG